MIWHLYWNRSSGQMDGGKEDWKGGGGRKGRASTKRPKLFDSVDFSEASL